MAERIDFEASSSSRIGVVVDHGRRSDSCGYCRSNGCSWLDHGLSAHSITADDYQEFLDRGWRRSGSFLYKPEMEGTCCPSYTIRLKVDDFVASREQIRVSRRMQRFLDGTLNRKKMISESSITEASVGNNLVSQSKKKKLEIRLKRSTFDPEEYDLYRRYQIKVHNENPNEDMESFYRSFLVETPIKFVPPSDNRTVPPCGFGSFHQQYGIDGKLVAVGVVDILPKCLSSKYLFWDPDFAFLSLGKYSALQEINWVKKAQEHCPSLQHYYLGYYIHSCSKMRYKAAYHPSELLCPLRYQWVPFHIAKPLLDEKPYVILSDFTTLQTEASSPCQLPENSVGQPSVNPGQEDNGVDISNIVIEWHGNRLRFKDLQRVFGPIEKWQIDLELKLQSYVRVVGTGLADRMVYSPEYFHCN